MQTQHIDIEINRVSSADHKITEDNANNPQITFCPACEQPAGDQTIECEECGEWYHFNCTGLDNKSADSIPRDIPFICLFCNDNLLYSQNPEEAEQSLNFDVNPSSNTEPKHYIGNLVHSHVKIKKMTIYLKVVRKLLLKNQISMKFMPRKTKVKSQQTVAVIIVIIIKDHQVQRTTRHF